MNCVPEQENTEAGLHLRQHYEAQNLGLLTGIWRQRRLIAGLAVAGLVAALIVCALLPNRYTSEAMIQVDLGRPTAVQAGQPGQAAAASLDAGAIVESEARVIRSRAVARRVVTDLRLQDDPDFAPKPGLLSHLRNAILALRDDEPAADAAAIEVERIAAAISQNLSVTNDARAYLITVAYTAPDPARAARLANAFVEAYQRNRLEMGVAEAERASAWLESRIGATRRELEQAETAIERYRQEANFVESGTASNLPQQELRDAQVQLVAAGQTRQAAEARLTRAREVLAAGGVPSAQDLTGAPVIQRMLENVETAKREVAGLMLTGPRHPRLLQAQVAVQDAEQRLRQELDRAIGNLESEVRTATAEEAALTSRVEALKGAVIGAMGQEAKLRSLQANAAAIRDRLKLLSDGHAQALALAGMKSSSAQVVMRAQPVPAPSGPKRPLIVALSTAGAAGFGVALSILLARRDTGFRSSHEIASETGVRCLSMIPLITTGSDPAAVRMFDEAVRIVGATLGWPHAQVSPQVLLVTSCVPHEGKSLLCMALAKLLAGRGRRTLVIDATGTQPARPGKDVRSLEAAVAGHQAEILDDLALRPVAILRAGTGPEWADHLLGESFETFLALARDRFDVVLIEAPPAMLVLDVLPLARLSDAAVLAVRWGRTPRRTVTATLQRLRDLSIRVRGIVLTQVDLDQHRHERFADQCSHFATYRPFYEAGSARPRLGSGQEAAPAARSAVLRGPEERPRGESPEIRPQASL
ncbi:MAG: polysaccharide biosynthesis tyrosine autokinase [Methylobacterium sp.]|uniref:GumC family protein n=1 Tax=Methylobacterium sp. TaxID=409 RepID=UPI002582B177|nr:polysaccharide biosynthesis tyrosine autokinase [Methylobacterium sp.]MBY0295193.1 polysaccharide biosynthesis tyrosine autokinase [Methylobacterium sp.]